VTVAVSQDWSEDPLCLVAVDYLSAITSTDTCDESDNVPPGQFGYYQVQCDASGYATITIYAQDSIFDGTVNLPADGRCSTIQSGPNTVSYEAIIPCSVESLSCEPIEPLSCGTATVAVADETFATSDNGWMHASLQNPGITSTGGEMVKSFTVPSGSSSTTVTFTFTEIPSTIEKVKFRVQDVYLSLGSFSKTVTEQRDGFLGDVFTSVTGNGPDSNTVTLTVPPTWYTR